MIIQAAKDEALRKMQLFFSPEAHADREARHRERMNPAPLEDLLPDEDEEDRYWAEDLI